MDCFCAKMLPHRRLPFRASRMICPKSDHPACWDKFPMTTSPLQIDAIEASRMLICKKCPEFRRVERPNAGTAVAELGKNSAVVSECPRCGGRFCCSGVCSRCGWTGNDKPETEAEKEALKRTD